MLGLDIDPNEDPRITKSLIGERSVFAFRRRVVARLRPGVALADFEAALAEASRGLAAAHITNMEGPDKNRILLIETDQDLAPDIPNLAAEATRELTHFVEPDTVFRAAATYPDDPEMFPAPCTADYWIEELGLPVAWDVETAANDARVTIAVLDGGIPVDNQGAITNPDLQLGSRLLRVTNHVGGTWDDPTGHGAASLGIIAAKANDSFGIAGVNHGSRIRLYKVLNQYGNASAYHIYSAMWNAVWSQWGGARKLIINASLQGPHSGFAWVMGWMVEFAGALLVASSGNYVPGPAGAATHLGPGPDSLSTVAAPAMYATSNYNIIGVGGAQPGWIVTPYSRRGPAVTVIGPSERVLTSSGTAPWTTAFGRGTSVAAPYVTGLASLIWAQDPSLRAHQVRRLVELGARSQGVTVFDETSTPVTDPSAYGAGAIYAPWSLYATQLRRLGRLPQF